jgi:hypothetical protein
MDLLRGTSIREIVREGVFHLPVHHPLRKKVMLNYTELKLAISEWSLYNFGDQDSKHPEYQLSKLRDILPPVAVSSIGIPLKGLAPLLGIAEEYGEYLSSMTEEDKEDALVDIGIFLLDFSSRENIILNPNQFWEGINFSILYGLLCHNILKKHQGIRENPNFKGDTEHYVSQILAWCVYQYNHLSPTDNYLAAMNKVWNKVKERDFRKYPGNGRPPQA